jgi:dipeptidase
MNSQNGRFMTGLILLVVALALGSGHSASSFITDRCDPVAPFYDGCTVVIVGRDASTDGSVMTTHTCDCSICDWTWRHVPAADFPKTATRKIYHIDQYETFPPSEGLKWDVVLKKKFTGLEIPQVSHTYAYHHGMFGYMNEHQLAIGESSIGCREKMKNETAAPKFDITMLTLLAMERCKTAREAIRFMGDLAEKHGYGGVDSGEMLAVADTREVWIFEIMPVGPLWAPGRGVPGAVWCAQRVPDDHVSLCPNESRIGEIDLNNPDYFMASPNAVSFGVKKGYYDPEHGQPFNWKKAYSPSEHSAVSSKGSRARLWRFFDMVAPSRKFSPATPNMDLPFSVKPDKKMSVQDVMAVTRDKSQGTSFDPVRGMQGGPFKNPNYVPRAFELEGKTYNTSRTICVNRAEYTTITQCRGWLPGYIGGIVWLCFGAQDTSCYMPLYAGMTDIPDSFKIGDHYEINRKSARWAFDYVDYHTQVAYSLAIEDVKKEREKWEADILMRIPILDKLALELFQKDPERTRSFLTQTCIGFADQVVAAWWKLGDDLLVKYNHFNIYDPQKRVRTRITFPEWWLKILVEQDRLKPQPEKKKK